jgi:hypothetical protein
MAARTARVAEINAFLESRDEIACEISRMWDDWNTARAKWLALKQELRDYVFAVDTSTTTNSSLPWKNKTTLPKLCQIRDNLHANYMAALFPNENWLDWIPATKEDASAKKAKAIKAFMNNKLNQAQFREVVSQLVYDYIDYGNAYGEIAFVREQHVDPVTKEIIPGFVGPRLIRVSPLDICYDVTAPSFDNAPKITRYTLGIGDIIKIVNTQPENSKYKEIVTKMQDLRAKARSWSPEDVMKSTAMQKDGMGPLDLYQNPTMVEVLVFEGDLYVAGSKQLYENQKIVIVDRSWVLEMGPQKNWFGKSNKKHVGWRLRPDNLLAMGPLDNLVGLQYRIDHLENLRADVFDLIAHPPLAVKGEVEDFVWGPNERIYMDSDGDVQHLSPDTTALNADFHIDRAEQRMEELAGAPKQAMGIRTPGEKTAYEVQSLENAAGRIFQNKVTYFESQFLEPIINSMFESARRNIDAEDTLRLVDEDLGITQFITITKADITAKGKLKPMGARHFAEKARVVQELSNFLASPVGMDPAVNVHLSGKRIAKIMTENLNLSDYGMYKDNVRLFEKHETTTLIQSLAQQNQKELQSMGGMDDNLAVSDMPQGQVQELENAGAIPTTVGGEGAPAGAEVESGGEPS